MAEHEHTPEELAALELYHQLVNLTPEIDRGDRALLVTLRLPDGRYVGDVWLSTQDVADLADASVGLAAVRECGPVPVGEPLLDVDAADVNDLIAEAEAFLNGGQI